MLQQALSEDKVYLAPIPNGILPIVEPHIRATPSCRSDSAFGTTIGDNYYGPRMQAALLGLFRLAHVWNQHHPEAGLGFLHVVFIVFNKNWRHQAMALLPPGERMGALALDALLGQTGEGDKWSQGWVTEVISLVLSAIPNLKLD
jgi:hypothetical protein